MSRFAGSSPDSSQVCGRVVGACEVHRIDDKAKVGSAHLLYSGHGRWEIIDDQRRSKLNGRFDASDRSHFDHRSKLVDAWGRMIDAMGARNVSISLGEGFTIRPGISAANFDADLDTLAELGVTRINTASMYPDFGTKGRIVAE